MLAEIYCSLLKCKHCFVLRSQSVRLCSLASYDGLKFNPKFTAEQQKKILSVLNEGNKEELARFDVSQGRIKNLESWRNKKGPFKSLVDILEVDGLGVKVLERLCESIVSGNKEGVAAKSKTTTSRRQFLSPPLCATKSGSLQSALGLYLAPTGISWAKLSREGNSLGEWGFHNFSSIPKKMLPTDTFYLATDILHELPAAEVYIFETLPSMSPQSNKQSSVVVSFNLQMELSSMLLALINTSARHSLLSEEVVSNKVYFLKSNLSARLFRTLIGSERVSSTATVGRLLDHAQDAALFDLPCMPVRVDAPIIDRYNSQTPVIRELLGQALLLSITFMDLCVYRNPASLAAVMPGKKLA